MERLRRGPVKTSCRLPANPKPPAVAVASVLLLLLTAAGSAQSLISVALHPTSVANGTLTSGQGTNSITFTAGALGSVTLKVTVTGSNGCKSTSSKSVPINTGC